MLSLQTLSKENLNGVPDGSLYTAPKHPMTDMTW